MTDEEAAAQYVVDRVQAGHRVRLSEVMAAFRAGAVYARQGTLSLVEEEVRRSRQKFPGNEHMLAALVEEVGEVARALLESKPRSDVVSEAVQVAATAVRLIEEGDADFRDVPK